MRVLRGENRSHRLQEFEALETIYLAVWQDCAEVLLRRMPDPSKEVVSRREIGERDGSFSIRSVESDHEVRN